MRRVLLFLCFFTLAATTWLGIMEAVLHLAGAGPRIFGDFMLALQSLGTMSFLIFRGYGRIPILLILSGGQVAIFGISAVVSVLRAPHFEGYLLIIGSALILQGGFTVAAASIPNRCRQTGPRES